MTSLMLKPLVREISIID